MLKYFALKNTELSWFNKPFIAQDEKEAKALVRNAILSDKDGVLGECLRLGELYKVGEFDTDRGRFIGKPELVCPVADIPLCRAEGDQKGV